MDPTDKDLWIDIHSDGPEIDPDLLQEEQAEGNQGDAGNQPDTNFAMEANMDNIQLGSLNLTDRQDADDNETVIDPAGNGGVGESDRDSVNPESDKENNIQLNHANGDSHLDDEDDNEADSQADHDNELSDDEDELPIPHIPDVPMHDLFNPAVNPAAAFWSADLTIPHPLGSINMYTQPPLPVFDTDPYMPFAPWHVSLLPPFKHESIDRVLLVPARFLAAVGMLYPDAEFAVSRYPAADNFTTRLKGRFMAQTTALHFPQLVDPHSMNHPHPEDDTQYLISLRRRDWPIGGVAFFPHTPQTNTFLQQLRGTFDVLPNGAEQWLYIPHDVVQRPHGGTRRGMWVCRAYEGRKGPQDARIIVDWMRENAGRIEQDLLG
ncbi:hypothetical protein C8A03DRAFT_38357, partial [Achaetomium macrosporum]